MRHDDSKTAVLLIHGIGIQNRFDFLADFTDGLVKSSESLDSTPRFTANENQPLGKGVTLNLVRRSPSESITPIDFYECYWSPMMNGATNAFSVVLFLFQSLYRMLPWAQLGKPSQDELPLKPKGNDQVEMEVYVWKWCQSVAYLLSAILAIAFFVFLAIGAGSLAIDRIALITQCSIDLKQYQKEIEMSSALPAEITYTSKTDSNKSYQIKEIDVSNTNKVIRLVIFHKDTEQHYKDFYQTTFLNGKLATKEWKLIADDEAALPTTNQLPANFESISRRTKAFYIDALRYPFIRGSQKDVPTVVESWPQIFLILGKSSPVTLLVGAVLALLSWTLLFMSLRVFFVSAYRLVTRQEVVTFNMAISIIAVVLIGIFSVQLASYSPVVLYLALSVLPIRIAYGITKVFLTNTLGDIEVYAQRNANSKKYAIREAVLERATRDIKRLLESKYETVIVVGHSLGSVVALEALRRLYHDIRLDSSPGLTITGFFKIKQFITIGSPIKKFALFFKAESAIGKYDELSTSSDSIIFGTDSNTGSVIKWTNYWNILDIVSDPLQGYASVNDRRIRRTPIQSCFWTHSAYWHSEDFAGMFPDHF